MTTDEYKIGFAIAVFGEPQPSASADHERTAGYLDGVRFKDELKTPNDRARVCNMCGDDPDGY